MNDYTGLQGFDFLQKWHAEFPGGTARHFSTVDVDETGLSSYDVLVNDVAGSGCAGRVLDLACGDGYLLELLVRRFPDATLIGVDASKHELELARTRAALEGVALIEARVEALPIEEQSIDAVVCHMALMLFDDARNAIEEVARVLQSGGIFAAVLGPAPGAGPGLQRFAAKLRDLEREGACTPLDVGDEAALTSKSLHDLFDPVVWRDTNIADTIVRLEKPEHVHEMLMGMYNVARLPEREQIELGRYLHDELKQTSEPFRSSEWAMGLRHIVAHRV